MCDLFGISVYLVADIVVAVGQQHCHLAKWIDQKGTSAIDIAQYRPTHYIYYYVGLNPNQIILHQPNRHFIRGGNLLAKNSVRYNIYKIQE
jgi:hypothetical protein